MLKAGLKVVFLKVCRSVWSQIFVWLWMRLVYSQAPRFGAWSHVVNMKYKMSTSVDGVREAEVCDVGSSRGGEEIPGLCGEGETEEQQDEEEMMIDRLTHTKNSQYEQEEQSYYH